MLLCHWRVRMASVTRTVKNGHTDILKLIRYDQSVQDLVQCGPEVFFKLPVGR